ncbi:MAG TPA: MlaD family protein [Steroidobacteraceae bacterium]
MVDAAETPGQPEEPRTRLRRHWLNSIWIVPAAAAAIVLWLAWRTLHERGPQITITFRSVEGLQPGQTRIQHRNVDLGTVESLDLTPDMSHVIVHAHMTRASESHLTDTTRFAIIAPHVGVSGISGLSTLVSGSYIEMYPGKPGEPQREFVGLDEPPLPPPDTPGRSFTLLSADLGSLSRGSPISYRGVTVGEVQGYKLRKDGQGVEVSAFIRAPHDRMVHPETRFWNAGGVDLTIGAQGIRFRANSWEQLLSGGIAFETPSRVLAATPSPADAVFSLYDNRRSAERAPIGPTLEYVADFLGNQRGLGAGTAVELDGIEVGEVREAHLAYDGRHHTIVTRAAFFLDPQRLQIRDMPAFVAADQRETVRRWIGMLVEQGLRAEATSVSFLTGFRVVALEMIPGAPRAHVEQEGELARIPSTESGDLTTVLRELQSVLKNIDRATSGPQLGHALQALDATLTRLDDLTREMQPDLKSLVKSLRDTADAAQNTLNTVQGLTGNGASTGTDLPRLMRELTAAARSVRELADYLDRHPEALLRGRKGDDR